jgi:hypothetical protein
MMPQLAARTKLSGPPMSTPRPTSGALIGSSIGNTNQRGAKFMQQRLAPGRTPTLADTSLADHRNHSDLMRVRCIRPHNSDADRRIS